MSDILQTSCKECGHECWHKANDDDYIYCPECGAKLNEYSSEDADSVHFRDAMEKEKQ